MLVKLPPAKILPSASTAILRTKPFRLGVRVERISQTGDRIEPGNVSARLSADAGEKAAHQDLAVRLHRDRKDIKPVAFGSKRISQIPSGIEPGDVVARTAPPMEVK